MNSERSDVVSYFEKMRDDARDFLRTLERFGVLDPEQDGMREFYGKRVEMCGRAIIMLAEEK